VEGDGHWAAIGELRRELSEQKARTAVNESQLADLRGDINGIGQKVDESETRVKRYVNTEVGSVRDRMDRGINWMKWGVGISFPIIFTLVGVLLGKGNP